MALWRIFVFLLVIWILETNAVTSQLLNDNLQTAETTTVMSTSTASGTNTTTTASGSTTGTNTVSGSPCAVVPQICQLLIQSQGLDSEELSTFVQNLDQSVKSHQEEVQSSAPTILAIIDILKATAAVGAVVTAAVMKNLLNTVDVLVSEDAFDSWSTLSPDIRHNASSELLGALEDLPMSLEEFSISTPRIQLNRNRFHGSYKADLTPSVSLEIPPKKQVQDFITTLTFSTLGTLLPHKEDHFIPNAALNADVLLIRVSQLQDLNVSVIFKKKNVSRYTRHKCVLWDPELSGGVGGWSYERCFVSELIKDTVRCNCSRLGTFSVLDTNMNMNTSFSILMSPHVGFIYFGAWVNVFFILICLVIEGCVWKCITTNSTALMRHVTIINTSICLLLGDTLFFCTLFFSSTSSVYWKCFSLIFFWHLFDLSLFFWMLVSCLLLFYRTSFVFSNMTNAKMFAIGFSLGYGAPLLIVTITVASTAPNYNYVTDDGFCMLDWETSMTVLSLVVPVLTIALVNAALLIVVLFNVRRSTRAVNGDADERRKLVVRLVFLLISFLLFGATRGLTLGMLFNPHNYGIYVAFGVINSLQGLCILVFGPLYDSQIRMIICKKCRKTPAQQNGTSEIQLS